MLSPKMQERLNQHLNVEFNASYLYLSMSAYCKSISLNGFANWYSIQSKEETVHAMKIYDYLIDQDAPVKLMALSEPLAQFNSIIEVVENTLDNEKEVSSLINDLAGFALKENDHATNIFLHWFVTEQIEEEALVRDVLEQLKMVGDSGEGLLLLDREMVSRKLEEEI